MILGNLKYDKVYYQADCDSPIPKGVVSLMIRVLSAQAINDIKQADLYFIQQTQLINYLSPNRVNGLMSLIARMKELACNQNL